MPSIVVLCGGGHQRDGQRAEAVGQVPALGLEDPEPVRVDERLERPLLPGLVRLVPRERVVDVLGPVARVAEAARDVIAVDHGYLLPTMIRALPPRSVTCSIVAGRTWL
jgi:hypothetical protein